MTTSEPRPLTREEEAHVEVGVTAISPRVARALVASFLALCCALPLFELTHVVRGNDAARAPWLRLRQIPADVSARTAAESKFWPTLVAANRAALEGLHDYEDGLEDEAVLGHMLRPRAQALLTGTLGAGNEQVYVGQDRWLFYRPDVDYVTGRGFLDQATLQRRIATADEWTTTPQPDPRPAILRFKSSLEARGILLVVMPVPVKPTVHPEKLGRRGLEPGAAVDNRDFTRFVHELRQAGVTIFDATTILRQAAQGGSVSQYLATDTHWRPEAMEMVASELAGAIRALASFAPSDDPGYRVETADVTAHGDAFQMLDLPKASGLFSPEAVTVRRVLTSDGSPWRSTASAEVLLLGDSFTNIYSLESMGWGSSAGFAEQLSLALRQPIDRIVQNDAGAYATREILQREGEKRLAGKKVVVWQFATRELAFGDWK